MQNERRNQPAHPSLEGRSRLLLGGLWIGLACGAGAAWLWLSSPTQEPTGPAQEPLSPAPPVPSPNTAQFSPPLPVATISNGVLEPVPRDRARSEEVRGRATFYGEVARSDGSPAAGAELWYDGELVGQADPDGLYRIHVVHVPIGWHDRRPRYPPLAAVLPGEASVVVRAPPRSERVDLVVSSQGVIRGHVLDRETLLPVPESWVELQCFPPDEDAPTRKAFVMRREAAADGFYRFGGIPAGIQALIASAPLHGMRPWYRVRTRPAAVTTADLKLQRLILVRGRFRDWPPEIAASPELELRLANSAPTSVSIDREGAFAFPMQAVPLDKAGLLLRAATGGVLWRTSFREYTPEKELDLGEISLPEHGTLHGKLEMPPVLSPELPVQIRALTYFGGFPFPSHFAVEADGSFVAGPLPVGQVALGVLVADTLVKPLGVKRILAGQDTELPPTPFGENFIAGWVRDEAGHPIARRAQVEVQKRRRDGSWSLLASVNVDDEGRYVLELRERVAREDHLRLTVTSPGCRPFIWDPLRPSPTTLTSVDARLSAGQTLRGHLSSTAGASLAGWLVLAQPVEPDPSGLSISATDLTTRNGRFELRGLGQYEHRISFRAPSGETTIQRRAIPDGTPLLVTISAAESSRGGP